VIGIIGALVALLLPVIGKVRELGRRAQCLSNLRQIGAGLIAYAAQEVTFPYPGLDAHGNAFDAHGAQWTSIGLHPPSGQYSGFCLLGQLYPGGEVQDAHIFYCPSAPTDLADPLIYQERWRHEKPPGDPMGWSDSSYSYRVFGADSSGAGPGPPKPYRPSGASIGQTSILCDIQVKDQIYRNHHGGSNVWYADGHATWVSHGAPPGNGSSVNSLGPSDQWSYPDSEDGWAEQPVKAWKFFDSGH